MDRNHYWTRLEARRHFCTHCRCLTARRSISAAAPRNASPPRLRGPRGTLCFPVAKNILNYAQNYRKHSAGHCEPPQDTPTDTPLASSRDGGVRGDAALHVRDAVPEAPREAQARVGLPRREDAEDAVHRVHLSEAREMVRPWSDAFSGQKSSDVRGLAVHHRVRRPEPPSRVARDRAQTSVPAHNNRTPSDSALFPPRLKNTRKTTHC